MFTNWKKTNLFWCCLLEEEQEQQPSSLVRMLCVQTQLFQSLLCLQIRSIFQLLTCLTYILTYIFLPHL